MTLQVFIRMDCGGARKFSAKLTFRPRFEPSTSRVEISTVCCWAKFFDCS